MLSLSIVRYLCICLPLSRCLSVSRAELTGNLPRCLSLSLFICSSLPLSASLFLPYSVHVSVFLYMCVSLSLFLVLTRAGGGLSRVDRKLVSKSLLWILLLPLGSPEPWLFNRMVFHEGVRTDTRLLGQKVLTPRLLGHTVLLIFC